jgi:hypothetical protein
VKSGIGVAKWQNKSGNGSAAAENQAMKIAQKPGNRKSGERQRKKAAKETSIMAWRMASIEKRMAMAASESENGENSNGVSKMARNGNEN